MNFSIESYCSKRNFLPLTLALSFFYAGPTFSITADHIKAYVQAETSQCTQNILDSNSNATSTQAAVACARLVTDLQPVAKPCYDLPAQNFDACFKPRYAKVKNCVADKKGPLLNRIETCIRQDFVV